MEPKPLDTTFTCMDEEMIEDEDLSCTIGKRYAKSPLKGWDYINCIVKTLLHGTLGVDELQRQ
jgi:hypothetical protein